MNVGQETIITTGGVRQGCDCGNNVFRIKAVHVEAGTLSFVCECTGCLDLFGGSTRAVKSDNTLKREQYLRFREQGLPAHQAFYATYKGRHQ